MIAVRRILCPVDFSEASRAALRWAVELAGRYGAELTLLHVHQPATFALPEGLVVAAPGAFVDGAGDIERGLHAMCEEAARLGARAVAGDTATGPTHVEICRYAEDRGFDLIVIGTHGRTGIAHALLGSTAERVVRHAHCPVMTVRADPDAARALSTQER